MTVAEAPKKKPKLATIVVRFGILLVAIWGFLWYVLPERKGGEAAARAEERAIQALREANTALAAFAAAQNGSFPPSLETLSGPSAERVKQAAQAALAEGYALEYSLKMSEPSGRQQHYWLLARPRNYGYRNLYTDETGVLRATPENRPASGQDPPI